MIYTLTTNPAIDMNVTTDVLCTDVVTRTREATYMPRGKGLNVSFTLKHFGVESTVLGFFGGFSGEYIVSECRAQGVASMPVWVEDATRINVFINSPNGEYNLVNAGSFVPREKQQELLRILREAEKPEVLCISGSLPRGIESSYYEEILDVCREQEIPVVLDISSPKLKELLAFHPLLIKPNDEELYDIFGLKTETEDDIRAAMIELHRLGAQNVLLTLGSRGSYFSNDEALYRAGIYPVKVHSTVCAGDASLAGFLSIWLRDRSKIFPALKRSAACGANVAESASLGDFARVEEYSHFIDVAVL